MCVFHFVLPAVLATPPFPITPRSPYYTMQGKYVNVLIYHHFYHGKKMWGFRYSFSQDDFCVII